MPVKLCCFRYTYTRIRQENLFFNFLTPNAQGLSIWFLLNPSIVFVFYVTLRNHLRIHLRRQGGKTDVVRIAICFAHRLILPVVIRNELILASFIFYEN